jgi:RNA polymerase sigma-70 factor (ECF subfamily)
MIDTETRLKLEAQIRARCAAGERDQAATLLIECYGRELLQFLISRLRERDAAHEVFSQFAEDLWRGLPNFRWECTARVWCYALARHAASRFVGDARRRRLRDVPLSRAPALLAMTQKIRSQTRPLARTETKNRLAQLRERLPIDDQTLLILRVNRKLNWKDIARVMAPTLEASDAALEKESARLRKRYQLVTERLRRMALREGLVGADGG